MRAGKQLSIKLKILISSFVFLFALFGYNVFYCINLESKLRPENFDTVHRHLLSNKLIVRSIKKTELERIEKFRKTYNFQKFIEFVESGEFITALRMIESTPELVNQKYYDEIKLLAVIQKLNFALSHASEVESQIDQKLYQDGLTILQFSKKKWFENKRKQAGRLYQKAIKIIQNSYNYKESGSVFVSSIHQDNDTLHLIYCNKAEVVKISLQQTSNERDEYSPTIKIISPSKKNNVNGKYNKNNYLEFEFEAVETGYYILKVGFALYTKWPFHSPMRYTYNVSYSF